MDIFAEFIDLDDPSFAKFCVNDGDIVGSGRGPKEAPRFPAHSTDSPTRRIRTRR